MGAFSHLNEKGEVNMVDISEKLNTSRIATARSTIHVGKDIMKLIKENNIKKGEVLSVSKLAGIMAAKKTSELIPLCHNINLDNVEIETLMDADENKIRIQAIVSCHGKTGVEMEALTAVTITALTIYDMCKAVSKNMRIDEIYLVSKKGGKSGDYNSEVD